MANLDHLKLCWNWRHAPFGCSLVNEQTVYDAKGKELYTYKCEHCVTQLLIKKNTKGVTKMVTETEDSPIEEVTEDIREAALEYMNERECSLEGVESVMLDEDGSGATVFYVESGDHRFKVKITEE